MRVVPPNKFGDQLKPGEGIAPPKKKRYACSNCHELGHTARTCKKPKAAAAKLVQKPAPAKPAPPRTSMSAGLSAELDVYADRMEENASVLRRAAAILRERP